MTANEKNLIEQAEAGDINAIKTLAKHYDKASGRWTDEPKLGESVSIEELFANMEREENEPCKEQAFQWFMRGAELGDPECMYEVGYRIYDAIGCCKDEQWSERGKKSFEWYLKSAQAGYVPAMRITAYMYGGLCVEKNDVEAFRWYLTAAKLGDKKSACEVVKHYAQGKGVEKNFDAAKSWLDELDDKDYRQTLHELSQGYDKESLMWLERLVTLDDPVALKHKAEAYCIGEGIEQDFQKALELFIKSGTSEPGDYNPDVLAEALCQAGNLYYTGEGTVPQNYEQALKYYSMATKFNYVKAYIQCGKMHYYGLGTAQNFKRAMQNFKRAINTRERYPFGNRGANTVAAEYIGRIYEHDADFPQAYHYYELAAQDSRNQEIIFRLANDYFYGNNVAADVDKALRYYESAGEYPSHEYYFEANLKLAWFYELENVEKNFAKADEYWAKLPAECKPART